MTKVANPNQAKDDHASEIATKIRELIQFVESKPDLWYPGLPPQLSTVVFTLDQTENRLRKDFGIEAVAPETPAA